MFESLPLYLTFLATAVVMLAVALTIYVLITPHPEITLIRQGNRAAAVSFGGTAIGMSLVLFSTAASTFDVIELAVWGGLGLVSQLFVFFVVWLLVPGLKTGMNEDNLAYGILLGALSIAMGILNAGALSL